MILGILLIGTPAGAHVGGTVNHLWNHLRPKADKRYLPAQNLPAGATMRGTYMLADNAGAGGQNSADGHSFLQQLASAPTPHFIPVGGSAPAECPGTVALPRAQPGHLCVYEAARVNVLQVTIVDPTDNIAGQASRWGFFLEVRSNAAGFYFSNGTWAATAPSG
jgi:hypothetical protein